MFIRKRNFFLLFPYAAFLLDNFYLLLLKQVVMLKKCFNVRDGVLIFVRAYNFSLFKKWSFHFAVIVILLFELFPVLIGKKKKYILICKIICFSFILRQITLALCYVTELVYFSSVYPASRNPSMTISI